jgi:hypothetical protein
MRFGTPDAPARATAIAFGIAIFSPVNTGSHAAILSAAGIGNSPRLGNTFRENGKKYRLGWVVR